MPYGASARPRVTIGDYALIGDCRSAALISRHGSVDWLCFPRFDSPSWFGAILDAERGGRFVVHPVEPFSVQRRYLPGTAVLETNFRTASGSVRLIDAMPMEAGLARHRSLDPDHEIVRCLEGEAGRVELQVICEPRPDYARVRAKGRQRGALGFCFSHRDQLLTLQASFPLALDADRTAVRGTVIVEAGERHSISLGFAHGEPAALALPGEHAFARAVSAADWWKRWSARCRYEGPHAAAVLRSAITLKLLTYAPSGAVIAAPTTSLPEEIGGVRNWDYRFCWLRDASLTLQALFDLGFAAEAVAFLSWLLHTTRMTRPTLRVVYDVFGEMRLSERTLDHLEGFAGSRPVRVGNLAVDQLQMDIYGEVIDAVFAFVEHGGRLDGQTARLLAGLGKTVCRRWREPDDGIWEARSGRAHHTYSKVMCAIALERLLDLHRRNHLSVPQAAFEREARTIRSEVEKHGYKDELGSYTATFHGNDVDASLLLLARYGYADATSPRMQSTVRRVVERLQEGPLLYRYRDSDDGLAGGEGAFGICSFWAVETLARMGDVEEAVRRMEELLPFANDVGLFAEEIDPSNRSLLGNFPQAFTHVGLIDAALTLAERTSRREVKARGARLAPEVLV